MFGVYLNKVFVILFFVMRGKMVLKVCFNYFEINKFRRDLLFLRFKNFMNILKNKNRSIRSKYSNICEWKKFSFWIRESICKDVIKCYLL